MAIEQWARDNFTRLKRAARGHNLAVLETRKIATGERVFLVCAIYKENGDTAIAPIAEMIAGNPLDIYHDPTQEPSSVKDWRP